MNNALSTSLLARFTRTRQRTVRTQEPADMGTAFGMEQWLDEVAGDQPALEPAAPRQGGNSWLPRWLQGGTSR